MLEKSMNIAIVRKSAASCLNRIGSLFLSIISISPAVLLILLVTRYWVNVPFGDQWGFSIIFDQYHSHSLSFSDLIAQSNESRMFFPRLITLGIGLVTGWNVCVEMCLIIVFACFISFNLFVLLNRAKNLTIVNKLTLLAIINLLLFSPVSWENWLEGLQMVLFIPGLMLTTGLVINTFNISVRAKLAYNTVLSIIGTFSCANGMLLWLLLFPVNVLFKKENYEDREKAKGELIHILLYLIVALCTIGFYFINYHKPPYHPPFFLAFSKPLEAIAFFSVWIATPFVRSYPYAPILPFFVGGLIFSIFILSVSYIIYRAYEDTSKFSYFYPWLVLGFYSIFTGIIITFGRLGFGVRAAAASRYTSISVFLPISTIILVYLIYAFYIRGKKVVTKNFLIIIETLTLAFFLILYEHVYRYSIRAGKCDNMHLGDGTAALISIGLLAFLIYMFYSRGEEFIVKKFPVIQNTILFFFLVLYINSYICSVDDMKYHNKWLENQKIALQFCKIIPDNRQWGTFYPKSQYAVDRFSNLTRIGLLDFRPVEPNILKWLDKEGKNGNESNGRFEECSILVDGRLRVRGWACDRREKSLADSALLVYTDGNGVSRPFATLRVGEKRQDVAEAFKSPSILNCGFSDIIDIRDLPGGNLEISAWSVDIKKSIAYQLGNTHSIRKL